MKGTKIILLLAAIFIISYTRSLSIFDEDKNLKVVDDFVRSARYFLPKLTLKSYKKSDLFGDGLCTKYSLTY
jgi:hypothetical protein